MVLFREAAITAATGAHPLTISATAPRYFHRDHDVILGMVGVWNPYELYFYYEIWEQPGEPIHYTLTAKPSGWLGGPAINIASGAPPGTPPPGWHSETINSKFYVGGPLVWVPGQGDAADYFDFTVDATYWGSWATGSPPAQRDISVVVALACLPDAFGEVFRAPYNSMPWSATSVTDPDSTSHPMPGRGALTQGLGDSFLHFLLADAGAWTLPTGVDGVASGSGANLAIAIGKEDVLAVGQSVGGASTSAAARTVIASLYLEQQPHMRASLARHRTSTRLYHARTGNHYLPDQDQRGSSSHDINPLWVQAHPDTLPAGSKLVPTGAGVSTGESPAADAPVGGCEILVRRSGVADLLYARWQTVYLRTSRDGGATWSAPVTIATDYDQVVAARDPVSGALVAMLYKVTSAGALTGAWYVTVGSEQADLSYTWSTPRAVASNAKPGAAALNKRSDGSWEFAYTEQRAGAWPWYVDPKLVRCRNLRPDGQGTWA